MGLYFQTGAKNTCAHVYAGPSGNRRVRKTIRQAIVLSFRFVVLVTRDSAHELFLEHGDEMRDEMEHVFKVIVQWRRADADDVGLAHIRDDAAFQ